MTKQYSRPRSGAVPGALASHMPAPSYEHRTKPVRNRPKVAAVKPTSTKPRANQVGRTKR